MKTTIILAIAWHLVKAVPGGYLTGSIIALIILGYLVYTLVKPEKF